MKRWLLLLAATRVVHAQPAPDPKQLYAEGKRYYDVGDYPRAIALWKQAYLGSSAPMLLFNIAQAYRLGGDCPEALRMYASYEHEAPNPPNREDLDLAKQRCIREPTKTHPIDDSPPAANPTTPVTAPATTPSSAPPKSHDVVPPGDPGKTLRTTGLVTGAAGVVLGITSIVLARRASSIATETGAHRLEWTAADAARERQGQSASTFAIVTGVASGAAIAGGVALYYLGWRNTEARHLDVAITPARTEVSWSVSF